MTGTGNDPAVIARIADEIRARRRFLLTSHIRPDGDAIGCELALAGALRALGKQVTIVNRDPTPDFLAWMPGADRIQVADRADGEFDAAIVLECGDLTRTGVAGIEGLFVINIDHHVGNTLYGAVNWFDQSVAACGELVQRVIDALDVALDREIAYGIYVALLTDTGSFHYSGVTPRTFDIARRTLEAGVDPVAVARQVFDSNTVGRIHLWGAVQQAMELDASGRIAVLYLDQELARRAGATYDDTEGLINVPLTVRDIVSVVFFKESDGGAYRVSFRSKGAVDVNAVAGSFGGGGHKNASGCTVQGPLDAVKPAVLQQLRKAVAAAGF